MRRSKSCTRMSGIPVASSVQRVQKTRSPSCGPQRRPSNSDLLSTPLYSQPIHNWAGSDSARSSLYPPSVTPRGVVSRRPGSSFGSRVGSARGKSPTAGKKLVRTNDKKWLEEQYIKVKEFIRNSGLFNPALADQIKPPTMCIFVELVTVLLGHLAKTIPINSQNCAEELMKWLKIMGYTGQITASTFRIVNTMHSWPNFISIIAFLIDRVDLTAVEEAFRRQLPASDQMAFNLRDSLFNYWLQKCGQMAESSDPENLDDDFYQSLIEITGIDCDEVQKTKEILMVQRANYEQLHSDLEEIQQKKAEIEAQNSEKARVIQQFEESGRNEKELIEEELEQNRVTLQKMTEMKEALTQSVEKLKLQVAQQPYTVKDKDELIRQIETQNRLLERTEQKTRQIQIVRDELDLNQNRLLTQVESRVDKWNISLKKTFLPELDSLRLREKGFFSKEDFGNEISEMLAKKNKLFEELLTENRKTLDELAMLSKRKQALVDEEILMNAHKQKVDSIKAKNATLQDQNEQLKVQIEEAREKHKNNLNQLKEEKEAKLSKLNKKLEKVEKELKQVVSDVDEICKCYLAGATKARNKIVEHMVQIKGEKIEEIERAKTFLNQETQRSLALIENLSELQKARKCLSEMYNIP